MVIVRCIGPEEFFLERVVFPFELLSFLAPPDALVEIWTHGLGGPELIETLDVATLQVEDPEAEPLTLARESSTDPFEYQWQEAV